MIQFGEVLEVFEDGTAKVFFPDLNKESGKLQILYSKTLRDKDYFQFDEKEVVLCLMIPQSEYTEGVIVGAVYNKKDKTPEFSSSHKIKGIQYEDGTKVYYDKENSILNIDCTNQVIFNCKKLDVTVEEQINISTKILDIKAESSSFDHDIECTDVITSTGSHNKHTHITGKEGQPTTPPSVSKGGDQ